MAIPAGFSRINPFIITDDVDRLITFLSNVFEAVPHLDARTMDTDGLLYHAEIEFGGATIMFAERKPDWPWTPSLLQVYVEDVEDVLARAEAGGARVVTLPTPFFGEILSRFVDPWANMWWIYSTPADDAPEWDAADWSVDSAETWEPTEEFSYIRNTGVEALTMLRDPRPR